LDQRLAIEKLTCLDTENGVLGTPFKGYVLDLGAWQADLAQNAVLVVDVVRRVAGDGDGGIRQPSLA
jgi:hypothetical protein